jgi:hypothetical protein
MKYGEQQSSSQNLLEALIGTIMDIQDIACASALAQLKTVFERIEAFFMLQLRQTTFKFPSRLKAEESLQQAVALADTFPTDTLQSLSLLLYKAQTLPNASRTGAEMLCEYTEEATVLMLASTALQGRLLDSHACDAWAQELKILMLEDEIRYRFAWEQAALLAQVRFTSLDVIEATTFQFQTSSNAWKVLGLTPACNE